MKKYLLLTLAVSALSSCATRPDGTRTFAGLDGVQWVNVGLDASAPYLDAKRKPQQSAKTAVDVTPEVEVKSSWLDLGLAFLGL